MATSNQNGQTSVTLSGRFVNALTVLNVQASGFGGTQISNGVAHFSITGGAADLSPTKVEIIHSGGLTLKAGSTEVSLTDFVITNIGGRPVLMGALTVNGDLVTRAPLFNLRIGRVGTSEQGDRNNLDLDNVGVTLTSTAAGALNQAFGVNAFNAGFRIGTAQVDARFNPANGNVSERQLPIVEATDSTSLFPGATQDVLSRGKTSVELSDDLTNALGSLNVSASGFGNTRIRNGVADFLITGGATDLDTTKVEIFHAGGLTLTAGNTSVNLTDFVVSNLNGNAVLTGAVTVDGDLVRRLPLFDLQIGGIQTAAAGRSTNLDLTDVAVTLTGRAARTLNRTFGVDAFTAGFNIGTAQVDSFVA